MSDTDPLATIDLTRPGRVRIGATRGEFNTEIGRPREYPDSVDLSVQTGTDSQILLTIDATAGDHATGHADIELTESDAEALINAISMALDTLEK
ncbi:hypothetical protein [Natronocalculus amylovorans]|uniref:Uncharacterized protein n=1 Tax=Natronocalculus amylovorans TaxID=2917812 RepID=A0AAE3FUG5_9EURY|nr:hypothetical protein [Natronocalculus amylovorans]MCL9815431.1 hypothetical protein [Natronocalculus amylovorans]